MKAKYYKLTEHWLSCPHCNWESNDTGYKGPYSRYVEGRFTESKRDARKVFTQKIGKKYYCLCCDKEISK